jgi:hypothetical protein
MIRGKSFPVGLFSSASLIAAAGLCISLPALGTHSSTTTTSSGTSTCKLCTHITWEFEAGDLDVEYVGLTETTPWSGTIKYTNQPGRTIKGKVCTDATQTECATAQFHIPENQPLVCTGYALKSCEKDGRRDSLKTFTQSCGAPTTDQTTNGLADCVGRLEATTSATSAPNQVFTIDIGEGVAIGGAVEAAQKNDCTAVFKNESGAFATKEMGRIVQKHYNSTNCNAAPEDIVDKTQNQRACSSPFEQLPGEHKVGTCYRPDANLNLVAQPAGITMTQNFLPVATGTCLPGTVESGCSVQRDSGVFRQIVTGAELAKLGVNPNQVAVSSFKCGDPITGIAPISVTPTNSDGDALTDYDVRCRTCTTEGVFLCAGGLCYLTGNDGAQPFASACPVTLQ